MDLDLVAIVFCSALFSLYMGLNVKLKKQETKLIDLEKRLKEIESPHSE